MPPPVYSLDVLQPSHCMTSHTCAAQVQAQHVGPTGTTLGD